MTKTIKPLLAMLLLIAGLFTVAQAQVKADDILGKWTNEDHSRVLEFVKNGSVYEAIIKDAPDKNLVGKKQLTQISFKKSSYSGTLYLPKKDKSLPCNITINNNGVMELTAKAGMMSKSQTWTRVR